MGTSATIVSPRAPRPQGPRRPLNAIVIATLLRALWTFNFIDLIWTMTRGGPANLTRTMPLYIFDKAYTQGDFGYAATVACVLCVALLVFSGLYWQLNRLAHEE
jgi:multiple sugar transport system permease protein